MSAEGAKERVTLVPSNPNYLRISVLGRRSLRHAVCHLLTVMRLRGKKLEIAELQVAM